MTQANNRAGERRGGQASYLFARNTICALPKAQPRSKLLKKKRHAEKLSANPTDDVPLSEERRVQLVGKEHCAAVFNY